MLVSGETTDTVLFADRVLLGGGPEPLEPVPAALRIKGPRIAEVVRVERERLGELESPHDAEVVDLGDRLITPAFVNGHTHLAMAAFRGLEGVAEFSGNVVERVYYRLEAALRANDIRAFSRLGAYESLLHGVGVVFDHYYGGTAVAEALRDTGLAGVVAPTLQDVAGPDRDRWEAALAATETIDEATSFQDTGIFAALGPHATDTASPDLWQRAADMAARRGLPVHAHLAQSVEEYERCQERHGRSPLARLARDGVLDAAPRVLLVHGLFVSDEDLALLDPARHVLGYCPFSQLGFGFPADLARWSRAKIPWVVGTDCAACNDSMNVQKELRVVAAERGFSTTSSEALARFQHAGSPAAARAVWQHRDAAQSPHRPLVEPARLLESVWAVPGSVHPKAPCGRIRPGSLAHLTVWDLDHPAFWPATDPIRALASNDTSGAIHGMMLSGRWIGDRGSFHRSILDGAEYREARIEADERLARLRDRL
jgi:5-methylthioadenosine/S-adenosylhomocysteine deaminase